MENVLGEVAGVLRSGGKQDSVKEGGREGGPCRRNSLCKGPVGNSQGEDESQQWRQRGYSSRADKAREADGSNHAETEATSKVCVFSLKVGCCRSDSSRGGTQA